MKRWFSMQKRHLPVFALVCVGTLVSAITFFLIHSLEKEKSNAAFEHAANQRFDQVQDDLDLAVSKLVAAGAFCEASYPVTSDTFDDFVRPIFHLDNPGIQALEWQPRVTYEEREAFEKKARAEGLDDYEIRDRHPEGLVRAPRRAVYFPVLYIHPAAGNEAVYGFDSFGADPGRHEALLQAESTGELTATQRLRLVQDSGDQYGLLIFRPVFMHESRSRRLVGFATLVLRIGELVEKHGYNSSLDLVVNDRSAPRGLQQLYPAPSRHFVPASAGAVQYRMISVGGRTWELAAYPRPGAFAAPILYSFAGAAISLLITLLVSIYIFDLLGRRFQVERVVEDRTAALNAAILSLAQVHRGLEESESRYRRLVEDSPLAIVMEREGRIVLANRAAVEMFGTDPTYDSPGRSIIEFLIPERRQLGAGFLSELHAHDTQLPTRETQALHSNGTVLDLEVTASSFTYDGKRSVQVLMRDISQRKRDQAENARLIGAIEQVDEAVVITDTAGHIVYVNPAFERVSGYSREEALGQTPRILKSGRQPDEVYQALWKALLSGESWSGQLVNRAKDGHLFTEEATISPVVNRAGKAIHYVAVKRDVTREVELQEQLRQSQKMDAVGRLAGGVAHDFNNMLMVIVSYAELIANGLAEGDPLRLYTEQVLRAAQRSTALTRQLLTFSRKQVLSLQVLDCNTIVMETSGMVRRLIAENIELKCTLASDLWKIKADPDQIVQVILNLCANSRDAMPSGGRLIIATRNCPEESLVELSVTDTGTGIAPELQQRLFEPFFTTKERSKGTGLGLATVYGIVQQSGGHIRVESEPGQGSTFRIYLPRCLEQGTLLDISDKKKATPQGRGIVLVVEDESALRQAISDQLRARKYQVFTAADGVEAKEILESHREINILVSDLIMPRMGGRELAQEAVRIIAGLRIIFMSGYADQNFSENEFASSSIAFIQKPFSMSMLLGRLADLDRTVPEHSN